MASTAKTPLNTKDWVSMIKKIGSPISFEVTCQI